MASSSELDRFVRDALAAGQSRASIRAILEQAGWGPRQFEGVLDDYADVAFPVPVPRPRASLSAREAFQYLVMFAALYVATWHFGSLLFDLIDRAFPDPAMQSRGRWDSASMRLSAATLLICFPVFAFMAWRKAREVERQPILRLSRVRRWLTYLTLFLAAGVLIGDLTALVYILLGGETSLRFLLKVLVVALLSGAILGYYLIDLRREETRGPQRRAIGRALLAASSLLVAGSIVAAIIATGSPAQQRLQALDRARVEQLQAIAMHVQEWHARERRLPASLAIVAAQPGLDLPMRDPHTSAPYEYRVLDATRYELCATFATDTAQTGAASWSGEWVHAAGRHCFQRRVSDAAALAVAAAEKAARAATGQ